MCRVIIASAAVASSPSKVKGTPVDISKAIFPGLIVVTRTTCGMLTIWPFFNLKKYIPRWYSAARSASGRLRFQLVIALNEGNEALRGYIVNSRFERAHPKPPSAQGRGRGGRGAPPQQQ